MQRFLVNKHCIDHRDVTLEGDVVHQIRDVLRLRKGARVIVFDNEGFEYTVVLERVEKGQVKGSVINQRECIEPGVKITLYQALLKADHFEFVLQKCTEIGVSEFVPIICERCVAVKPRVNKIQRWEKVIKEAAEQSGRGMLPVLKQTMSFDDACRSVTGLSLIAGVGSKSVPLKEILRSGRDREDDMQINIFIGPEGGFIAGEMETARRHGVKTITLGPRVLRAETAGLVAATIVLFESGELDKSLGNVGE